MGSFLEGEDSHGDHGLGRLVEFRFKAPPGTTSSSITTHTSSGQRNCASWASQPQKSVTLLLCPGGRTTKSTKRTCGGTGGKKRKKKKNSHCAHKLLIITRSVTGTKYVLILLKDLCENPRHYTSFHIFALRPVFRMYTVRKSVTFKESSSLIIRDRYDFQSGGR